MQVVEVYRIPSNSPDDTGGLEKLLADGTLRADEIVCILGKTEGNGCVNDFTRGFATRAYGDVLARELGGTDSVDEKIALIMSGGTEGVLAPHVTIFARSEVDEPARDEARLAIGVSHTLPIPSDELGTVKQALAVAKAVGEARREASIEVGDVHFVQVKCPLLSADRISDALAAGQTLVTTDTYKSMGYSRGASALGIAVELGEIDKDSLSNDVICSDFDLYSSVASTSAGVELTRCEIMVLGNSTAANGHLVIGHSVMNDAIDAEAVYTAIESAGVRGGRPLTGDSRDRIVAVLAKAEASSTGRIRDRRHTMLNDSDINHTRHARAAVGAVVASVVGDPMVYVSGGAEHQGPDGGGPVAAIVRAG